MKSLNSSSVKAIRRVAAKDPDVGFRLSVATSVRAQKGLFKLLEAIKARSVCLWQRSITK